MYSRTAVLLAVTGGRSLGTVRLCDTLVVLDYAFREVVKAYKATRAGDIDKQEFRFGDYWEQAIAAAILRGQAAVAGRAKWPRELQAPPGGEHHADMGA